MNPRVLLILVIVAAAALALFLLYGPGTVSPLDNVGPGTTKG